MVVSTDRRPNCVAIIPARFDSKRFPGKVIEPLAGKPLIVHTYERTIQASCVDRVLIATDDERVVDALKEYGIETVMTRSDHESGTDRIAEAAEGIDVEIVVNVQGDEPLVDPSTIDQAVHALIDHPEAAIATAKHSIQRWEDIEDPNVVKVVTDLRGRALYFSRSRIPYIRGKNVDDIGERTYWQHVGLYVYRKEFLAQFPRLEVTPLEELEKLEQLRALENGCTIVVVETDHKSIGVDTPEDLERVRELIESQLD
jgi:3-deoxy-manno-octulosonate cytidylyltransferase (CMP-KDO synthetase)